MKFQIEAVDGRTVVYLERGPDERIYLQPEAISIDLGPDGHNSIVMAFPLGDVAITLGGEVTSEVADDLLRAADARAR